MGNENMKPSVIGKCVDIRTLVIPEMPIIGFREGIHQKKLRFGPSSPTIA
jgi:hypothetical protein